MLWVLSPFVAFVLASVVSKRWSVLTRATLYVVMLVITLGSLAIYGAHVFGSLRAKTGFVFLVVPAVSWLLSATVVPIAALISRRLSASRCGRLTMGRTWHIPTGRLANSPAPVPLLADISDRTSYHRISPANSFCIAFSAECRIPPFSFGVQREPR